MKEKHREDRPEKADPFEPIKALAPEEVVPGVENERLVTAEKKRIEAGKKATGKPEITPGYHTQDSAA